MQHLSKFYTAAAAVLMAIAISCAAVTPAQAAKVHPLLSSFELPGTKQQPWGVAVNESTHHIYVVGQDHQIYNFASPGKLDSLRPELTGQGDFDLPFGVTVDNSAGPGNGYIYVVGLSKSQGTAQQFDPSGAATSVSFTDAAIPADGTPQAGGLPPVVNKGGTLFKGVTIHDDKLFVIDQANGAIDVFTLSGTFVEQLGVEFANFETRAATGIDLNAAGELFVATTNGLFRLDPAGKCIGSCTRLDPGSEVRTYRVEVGGVEVDSAGNIFAPTRVLFKDETKEEEEEDPSNNDNLKSLGYKLNEYSPEGELISVSGADLLVKPFSVALDEAGKRLFVTDTASISVPTTPPPDVKVFGPLVTTPDVTTGEATGVTDSAAEMHGTIGADGGAPATCVFQYVNDVSFKASKYSDAEASPCEPAGPFVGEGTEAVEAQLSGLSGGTTYHFRIFGSNAEGTNAGEDKTLHTHGPFISSQSVTDITETSARLEGAVNPMSTATEYSFEYVSQPQFEAGGYSEATVVPAGGEAIGAGAEDIAVGQDVAGLSPGTTYHFRLTATSADGSSTGSDTTFKTYISAPAGLPDGRAYEQASPVQKNGANAEGEVNAVAAAPDGGAITFYSTAGIPGGEGAQVFPSYLASRAADGSGWSTQGLLPPASAGPMVGLLGWSEELRESFASAKQVGSPPTLYRRSSSDGSLTAVGSGGTNNTPFTFAATSAGGSTAVFESAVGGLVAGDLPGGSNVYAWDRESAALVVAAVFNDGQAPPQGAFAGSYDWFVTQELGRGGATDQYYTQTQHVVSSDGSRVFFTAAGSGQIYLRQNPLQAQSPIDSGGNCLDPSLACTVRISVPEEGVPDLEKPAAFVGASSDGSVAFFLSAGKLTKDATGGGLDLYRYEVSSGVLTDLTAGAADEKAAGVRGVLGISQDGSDVYFAADGDLAAGVPAKKSDETNFYAIHDGATEFIARLRFDTGPQLAEDERNWAPVGRRAGGTTPTNTSRLSADGQTLVFRSSQPLTEGSEHDGAALYRYRAGSGLSCISCNPTGVSGSGGAEMQAIPKRFTGPRIPHAFTTRNLSADGNRVIFDSAEKLVGSDVNGVNDVYEWEAKGTGSCAGEAENGGCLYLISSGTGVRPSYFADADASGGNVFFFTDQSLVAQDKDELVDVYNARVGGGIAAQNETPPPPCEGEACQGQLPPAPVVPSPGSASFTGPGDPKAKHKKHHKKKHKKHAKGKKHTRGGSHR
jgi:sugar lactone lactonase YvrE